MRYKTTMHFSCIFHVKQKTTITTLVKTIRYMYLYIHKQGFAFKGRKASIIEGEPIARIHGFPPPHSLDSILFCGGRPRTLCNPFARQQQQQQQQQKKKTLNLDIALQKFKLFPPGTMVFLGRSSSVAESPPLGAAQCVMAINSSVGICSRKWLGKLMEIEL